MNQKRTLRTVLTLVAAGMAIVTVLAMPAAGQFANADLTGKVTDQQGGGIPGITITATNEATGISRHTVTTANGSYQVTGLRPGTYTVRFELEGFQTQTQAGVPLRVGQTSRLNVSLELGTVEEAITVTSEAPVVEVDSKEIGGTVTSEEFEALPTQNRSALLFAALLPGVIASPSTESTASDALFINGQDDNNNSFNVDGANNDDDVIGARAGAQTRTAIEAIQEFQVLTTQFDAEFGRSTGGVLNAITRSGGNSYKGTVFAYEQDGGRNEENFFTKLAGEENPDTSYEALGFTVGGPIARNKAHFFVSVEDVEDNEGFVRDFSPVGRPEFNFSTTENNTLENRLAKIDYQPTDSQHLAFRWLREESPQFNQIIGNTITLAASREEDDTDFNWIGSLESVLSNSSLNIARVSFTEEDVSFANPGFNNNGQDFASQRNQDVQEQHPGFIDGASTVAQSRVNQSFQIDDTFSWFLPDWHGEHQWRLGLQYSDRSEEFTNFGTLNGVFFNFQGDGIAGTEFDGNQPFDPNDIRTYPGAFTIRVGGGLTADIPDNEVLGLFAQDDWKVNGNLTLNLGVRYDKEDITDDDNIAPRIGFSWDPRGKGKTVVRGGYGRFYDRFQLGFYSGYFLDAVTISSGFTTRIPDAGNSQQLFFDIVQQNGFTTLNELRDFLAAQLEGSAGPLINTNPTVENPNRKQAYVDTFSIGAEHEVLRGLSIGVDIVRSKNEDTPLSVDLNDFQASKGGRPNISILNGEVVNLSSITTHVNAGETTYEAVQVSIQKRFNGRYGGRVSYTLADSEGNYDGGATDLASFQTRTESGYNFDTGQFIGEPLNLGFDDPRGQNQPVSWHRDNNLVVSGQVLIPKTSWRKSDGLIVSGIYRYMDGNRFTVFSNNVFLENGARSPHVAGTFDSPQDLGRAQKGVNFSGTRQGAEDPSFARLDLSLRYRIPFGPRLSVTLLGDIYNATNHVNWASNGGSVFGTSGFLVPTSAFNPREFQIGARFNF